MTSARADAQWTPKDFLAASTWPDLGRVAVLMGGFSAERSVSLKSGRAVSHALNAAGVTAEAVDVTQVQQLLDLPSQFDRAFIALHGRWGEDGGVQAVLDALDMPYCGSQMPASALAMDKIRTKYVWQAQGLPTPAFSQGAPSQALAQSWVSSSALSFPMIVKPSHEGSSLGMQKVNTPDALYQAWSQAQALDSEVLVEQWVTGREMTATVVNHTVLPLIELQTDHAFYDFSAKYESSATQYLCPVAIDSALQRQIEALVLDAFDAVGARHWGRVDLIIDADQQPWLIEINTAPGMTDHSLVPMAAKQAGLSFPQLVRYLMTLTLATEATSGLAGSTGSGAHQSASS